MLCTIVLEKSSCDRQPWAFHDHLTPRLLEPRLLECFLALWATFLKVPILWFTSPTKFYLFFFPSYLYFAFVPSDRIEPQSSLIPMFSLVGYEASLRIETREQVLYCSITDNSTVLKWWFWTRAWKNTHSVAAEDGWTSTLHAPFMETLTSWLRAYVVSETEIYTYFALVAKIFTCSYFASRTFISFSYLLCSKFS